MRAVATSGRWIWGLSGLITTAVLVVSGTALITSAGQAENAQPQSTATRTVTVSQPVTSLTVQSYGGSVQVTAGPVRHVEITETIMYDPQDGGAPAVASAVPTGPFSASPAGVPSTSGSSLGGPPAVVQSVSGGHLSLAAPACATSDCSVGFSVITPSDVTVTATTEGGPVTVSRIAGANLDSGNGSVSATNIGGPLTVNTGGGSLRLDGLTGILNVDTGGGPLTAQGIAATSATITTGGGDAWLAFATTPGSVMISTDGGSLVLNGLTGTLSADTGGGPLTAQGIAATSATITTGGGDARMTFSAAPDSVMVSTDSGSAQLAVPGGPYALNADSDGGPQSVGIATDPDAHRSITVISGGGPLLVGPAGR